MATDCSVLIVTILNCLLVKGTDAITKDPCPADIDKSIVATMCQKSLAKEPSNDGAIPVDSVVLRVLQQKDNCVCKIGIQFQTTKGYDDIFCLRKYNDYTASAPTSGNCGLEIHISSSNHSQTFEPIICQQGYNYRKFHSPDFYELYLTSMTTADSFVNGYCLQFFRNTSKTTPATLTMACFNPQTSLPDEPVTSQTEINNEKLVTTRNAVSANEQHSSTLSMISEEHVPGQTNNSTSNMLTTTLSKGFENKTDIITENQNQTFYFISGAGAGGGLFIIIIVAIVTCKCRKRKSHHNKHTQETNSDNENRDSYGLQDNILYVSSDAINAPVGNYAYVDIKINTAKDIDQSVEPKLSERKDNGSNIQCVKPKTTVPKPFDFKPSNVREDKIQDVYAVVNKAHKKTSDGSLAESFNEYVNLQL